MIWSSLTWFISLQNMHNPLFFYWFCGQIIILMFPLVYFTVSIVHTFCMNDITKSNTRGTKRDFSNNNNKNYLSLFWSTAVASCPSRLFWLKRSHLISCSPITKNNGKIAQEKKCFSSIPRLENRKDTKPVGDRNTKWTNCIWRNRTFTTMKHILNGHHTVLTYNDE